MNRLRVLLLVLALFGVSGFLAVKTFQQESTPKFCNAGGLTQDNGKAIIKDENCNFTYVDGTPVTGSDGDPIP